MPLVEISKEDRINIGKWMTATTMMIEANLRKSLSDSERKTFDKIWNIQLTPNVKLEKMKKDVEKAIERLDNLEK